MVEWYRKTVDKTDMPEGVRVQVVGTSKFFKDPKTKIYVVIEIKISKDGVAISVPWKEKSLRIWKNSEIYDALEDDILYKFKPMIDKLNKSIDEKDFKGLIHMCALRSKSGVSNWLMSLL
jgi:hypothetical protein